MEEKKRKIVVTKAGPYQVSGKLPLDKQIIIVDRDGIPIKWGKGKKYPAQESYALCRCGHSNNKPYCDFTHLKIGFKGAEVASRKKYLEQAEKITGPHLILTDAEALCSNAQFCHRAGGIWKLTFKSDPKSKKIAVEEACDCPSGRLVVWDKRTKKPIEPKLKPSISLVEDPDKKASGPIWVKGGVPVESADGKVYEVRNRCTLCRCGKSHNKPFCDGTHVSVGFDDGDESLKKGRKKQP